MARKSIRVKKANPQTPAVPVDYTLESITGAVTVSTLTAALPAGADTVEVSGSGFGLAPNVVLFRTYDEGSAGGVIPLTAPTGQTGDFFKVSGAGAANLKYISVGGKMCMASHQEVPGGANVKVSPWVSFTPARRLRLFYKATVPSGYTAPSPPPAPPDGWFGSLSSWKFFWLWWQDGAAPDICIPTQIASSSTTGAPTLNYGGNSTQWSPRIDLQGSGDGHVTFQFGSLNGYSWWQDCDSVSATTNGADKGYGIVNSLINGFKPVGFWERFDARPAFNQKSGTGITHSNAFYGEASIVGWSREETETVMTAYKDHYLATESSDGAGDWYQCVMLGNNAVLEDCTDLIVIPPDSWTDTAVTFTRPPGRTEYTHWFVHKPDRSSVVSGAF